MTHPEVGLKSRSYGMPGQLPDVQIRCWLWGLGGDGNRIGPTRFDGQPAMAGTIGNISVLRREFHGRVSSPYTGTWAGR
jgi:hypothetical protein